MKSSLILLLFLIVGCRLVPLSRDKSLVDVDIKSVDFCSGDLVRLDGAWSLVWGKLISSIPTREIGIPAFSASVKLPTRWTDARPQNGIRIPPTGFGTLQLRVKLPPKPCMDESSGLRQNFSLTFSGQALASEVEILDGTGGLIASPANAGRVGTSPESSAITSRAFDVTFPWASEITILWRFSNFQHVNGGPWGSVQLGTEPVQERRRMVQLLVDVVIVGATVSLGIYLLLLFLIVPNRRSALWLGLFCLILGSRPLVTEGYLQGIFGGENVWAILHKIDVLIVYLGPLSFLFFLRAQYFLSFRNVLVSIMFVVSGFGVVWTTLVPHHLYYPVVIIAQLLAISVNLLAIYLTAASLIRLHSRATWMVAGGILIMGLTVVLDILTNRGIIYAPGTVPFGLLVFSLSEAASLVIETQRARLRVERLASELHDSAESLKVANADLVHSNADLGVTRARLESVLHATRLMNFAADSQHVSEIAISAMVREITGVQVETLELWLLSGESIWRRFAHHRTVVSDSAVLRFQEQESSLPPDCPIDDGTAHETQFGRRSCFAVSRQSGQRLRLWLGVQRQCLAVVCLQGKDDFHLKEDEQQVLETIGVSMASVLANLRLMEAEKENLLRLVSMSSRISDRLNSPIMAAVNAVSSIKKQLESAAQYPERSLANLHRISDHLAVSMQSLVELSRELEELRERGSHIEPTRTLFAGSPSDVQPKKA